MITWEHREVIDYTTAHAILCDFRTAIRDHKVTAAGFDTETTGLNPVLDTPFLHQCGWYDRESQTGTTVVTDLQNVKEEVWRFFLKNWHALCAQCPIYLGHHVVYDLHMLTNINEMYTAPNISDTQFYIRASSDAVQTEYGGEPLGLKEWATKHISKDAKNFEKELKQERTQIASEFNKRLLLMTGWKKKAFDNFFKDKINDYTDLPQDVRAKWLIWHRSLPEYLQRVVSGTVDSDMIRYDTLNRENVKRYGHYDIVYTLTCYDLCKPVVDVRKNMELVRRENQDIYPLYRMERVGLQVDREYIKESKKRMKDYIKRRRNDLTLYAGCALSVGQHEKIKEVLKDQFCLSVESTGAEALERLASDLRIDGTNQEAVEFIETILELRTLEKWYSTYICKFDAELKRTDKIYTSIHQVQAVTGRVSCDFQQFPKKGIVSIDDQELFSPRKMVVVSDDYPAIIYLDYSQIELRLQALYTYLLGHADLNLCRAYSPYKCHRENGKPYNPETDTAEAYVGTWYKDEDNTPWTPTDVHGATTEHAFGITPDDPKFHDLRYVGKRVNFAKNYGAAYGKIREMFPEYSAEQCKKIDEAYYKAFPGVKAYHEACMIWAQEPYMDNLFGVKYYGVNGHKLRNTLVQGTGAYFLKEKVAQVDKYLQDNHCKSQLMMQIHDELQFKWHKDDDPKIFFDIKKIMQDTEAQMPIIADMEVTNSTWKDKVEVETLDELCKICYRR